MWYVHRAKEPVRLSSVQYLYLYTHTHLTALCPSGTTRVSRYQKGKTNLDFTEAKDSEWQWHQPGHMQVCTLLQTDNHTSTPPLVFFTGQMPFLSPNQQRQSTEGSIRTYNVHIIVSWKSAISAWAFASGDIRPDIRTKRRHIWSSVIKCLLKRVNEQLLQILRVLHSILKVMYNRSLFMWVWQSKWKPMGSSTNWRV